jgi:hypothetical protein
MEQGKTVKEHRRWRRKETDSASTKKMEEGRSSARTDKRREEIVLEQCRWR